MAALLPFTSSIMSVKDDWIDYNGHLNMAYYNVLFDRCVDEFHDAVGLGVDYRNAGNASTFTAEAHVVYVREIHRHDKVRLTCRVIDCDEKRTHIFLQLHHVEQGFLSAVSEQLHLHVDMDAKRVIPFPGHIQANIQAMKDLHAALPSSPYEGRVIGIRRK